MVGVGNPCRHPPRQTKASRTLTGNPGMYRSLSGKVAVVIGASSESGLQRPGLLQNAGTLLVLAARSTDKPEQAAGDLDGTATAIATDVTSTKEVDDLIAQTIELHGRGPSRRRSCWRGAPLRSRSPRPSCRGPPAAGHNGRRPDSLLRHNPIPRSISARAKPHCLPC
jgi:NAD(P)-dependent dehydrogenase (short-subunit alcohol dehydrogenase family)